MTKTSQLLLFKYPWSFNLVDAELARHSTTLLDWIFLLFAWHNFTWWLHWLHLWRSALLIHGDPICRDVFASEPHLDTVAVWWNFFSYVVSFWGGRGGGGGVAYDSEGELLTRSNNWGSMLVLVQELYNLSGGLVGKSEKFCTRSKDWHIVSRVSNRFRYIEQSLHISVLLVSENAFCKPWLPEYKLNDITIHNWLMENQSVGHWSLVFGIAVSHNTPLVPGEI